MDYEKEYISNFFDIQNYLGEDEETNSLELDFLEEAKKDSLTIYDLRAFYSVMADTTSDGELKKLLKSMIKTLAKMEIFKRKVPPIMKLKNPSPSVKSFSKN